MDLCATCLAAPSAVFARTIKRFLILLALVLFARPALTQERTMMPVTIDGEQVKIATITYRPTGAGPFPTMIFHHGSTGSGTDPSRFSRTFDPGVLAYWFVSRGWAVVLPSRRGRGGSEGLYDEGFSRFRASGYTCDSELSLRGADRALRDIDAITDSVLALPFVDRTRFVVGGNSRGGILSVAWAGKHPAGPRGVINFVGGWLGEGCPTSSAVNQQLFKLGAGFPRPTLWLYGDNDPYYSLSHSEANFEAFRQAGGKGAFHEIGRGTGMSGHQIHVVDDVWSAIVAAYLRELGLPDTDLAVGRRQATDDEIRAAFVGKTVDWGPSGGTSVYKPDGRYEFTLAASGTTPGRSSEGVYWIEKGEICFETSAHVRRCDRIIKVDDAYHLITWFGGQYPAQIR
jgi:pimeloyl-ACP methyl ester carboxylesterase